MRTLAIDPDTRGFGFVVLEGSERLIDWGLATSARDGDAFKARVVDLIARYRPALLVVEDVHLTRRACSAHERIAHAEMVAVECDIWTLDVARGDVRAHFAPSGDDKHEIAEAIARYFPELDSKLPRRRTFTENEDPRMSIFDAASFALVVLRALERGDRVMPVLFTT